MAQEKDLAAAILDGNLKLAEEMRLAREASEKNLALNAKAFEAAQKKQQPSNIAAPQISVFNPRGEKDYPMPALVCEIWAPWKIHPAYHGLDREEVELFNLLIAQGDAQYTFEGNDELPIKVTVKVRRNEFSNAPERCDLTCLEFSKEHKGQKLKAMRTILREVLGDKAHGVMPMVQERKLILAGELPVSIGA